MTEAEYDEHVAPLLLQAAKEAERLGGTVLCYAEYGEQQADGTRDVGRTQVMSDPTATAKLVDMAMRCRGNLDSLAIGLIHAHSEGALDLSNTIFLQQMQGTPAMKQ